VKVIEALMGHKIVVAPSRLAEKLTDAGSWLYSLVWSQYGCSRGGGERQSALFEADYTFLGPTGECIEVVSNDGGSFLKYMCNASMVLQFSYYSNDSTCAGNPASVFEIISLENGSVCNDQGSDGDSSEQSFEFVCTSSDPVIESGVDATETAYASSFSYNYLDPNYICAEAEVTSIAGIYASAFSGCLIVDDIDSAEYTVCQDNNTISVRSYASSNCSGESTMSNITGGCFGNDVFQCV
jgi:hypothetical protein